MEDSSESSPPPVGPGSMKSKESFKSSQSYMSSPRNGASHHQKVISEEADNPRRRGRPSKIVQKPDIVVGKGLLITSRGKHANPGLVIHARDTFTNKFTGDSFPSVFPKHHVSPASNLKRQAHPAAKKQKHGIVEISRKSHLSEVPKLKYQEGTSATAVESSCMGLSKNQEKSNGKQRILKANTFPPKKKQKQGLLEVASSKDFPKHTGKVGLASYEQETLQAGETPHNVVVNSRTLLQGAVDSTSESEDLSNSCSSEGEKDKEFCRSALRSNEIFENGSKVYNDRSCGLVNEQLFEFEKNKASPLHRENKKIEGLSDTSEKTHNRGRKRVATTVLPPDELRCIRSDGRSWRCTAYAIPGGRRCQKHLSQLVAAQKKQQMNKGSAFVRVTSGKTKFQPSDFCIVPDEAKRRDPASSILLEKASRKISSSSKGPLVQRNLNAKLPSTSRDDVLFEHSKNQPLLSNHLTPSDMGKGQSDCCPHDGVRKSQQGKSCHQCERNDKGAVILCSKCNQKRYCLCCITRWYSDLSEQEVQKACPFCRGRCVCKSCLHLKQHVKEEVHMNKMERLKCLQYMLAFILPFLKRLNEVQCSELELESTLRGSPVTKLIRAPIGKDDCVFCDNCGTSIVDFHRSCPDCDYDLCLTCCQELRQGKQPGVQNPVLCPDSPCKLGKREVLHQVCDDLSRDPISKANVASVSSDKDGMDISQVANQATVWRAIEDGNIPCAPPERGCGSPFLILKTLHRPNYLENLAKEVEASIDSCALLFKSEYQACALCDVGYPDISGDASSSSRLAAQRSTSNDNFIYTPHNDDKDLQHFQRHWIHGEPVIVKDVLRSVSDVCWEPMAMWRSTQQFTRHYMHDELKLVTAIDCFNWQEVDVGIHDFLRGYEVGYMDQNGWPKMMKLFWPPSSIFEERLSRHCAEFISCIPFSRYTHPRNGILNLAAKFPDGEAKPDIGPKSYIAYGVAEELGVGDSVTKLQCGASDMVCVLVHTSEAKLTAWQWKKAHKSRERLDAVGEGNSDVAQPDKVFNHQGLMKCTKVSDSAVNVHSIADGHGNPESVELHVALELSDEEQLRTRKGTCLCESNSKTGGRPVTETASESNPNMKEEYTSDKERHENESVYASESDDSSGAVSEGTKVVVNGGAIWDVFRQQDVPRLQSYLEKYSKDLKHQVTCESIYLIHDQSVFLNGDHKKRLKEEYQIEAWTFEQNLGEAVFIPAGCPFQVRNLKSCTKVALDFLSPESLQNSLHVTEEYRLLPRNHHANEDKLQVKNMIVHAASQAIAEIRRLKADKR